MSVQFGLMLWVATAAVAVPSSSAFAPSSLARIHGRHVLSARSSTSVSMSTDGGAGKKILVISPPGGVGEVAAVEAAKLGGSVRWFVVSPTSSSASLSLAEDALTSISAAGGSVDLAGADAPSLLLSPEDPESAIAAVAKWCGSADGVVCTLDGVEVKPEMKPSDDEKVDMVAVMTDAIKIASREASGMVGKEGVRLAILSADDMDDIEEEEQGGGMTGLLSGLLGKGGVPVPNTLGEAMGEGGVKVTTLRHGELFGIPESSPEFSPFVGGPRRDPVLRDEYTMRSVRIDPTISISGNAMMGSATRSSRLSLGAAAAQMALRAVPLSDGIDVCLTSQRGTDATTGEEWKAEFGRVEEMLSSGAGAQLFKASFATVPNTERLAEWIATKWAPAVLRTYELAGIRIGSRPVFATKTGERTVEIVWQQLVDFQSVTVGKMIIEVSDTELVASRGPGDASAGFGSISLKPLAGEDVLVRRLADAASQAIEKGLATKATTEKKVKEPKKVVPPAPVSSTVQSSGNVVAPAAVEPQTSLETGPRSGGARRSSERTRGKRRKSPPRDDSKPESTQSWQ